MAIQGQPFVTFQPTHKEKGKLEAYCKATRRSKTDVLRELIRSLPDYRLQVTETSEATVKATTEASNVKN
jgi:hypothetical protein